MTATEVQRTLCEDCGGSGWIPVEGADDQVRPCSCRKTKDVDRLFSEAGVPARYVDCRLDNFRVAAHEQLVEALSRCRHYVRDFLAEDGAGFRDCGLIFSGAPGVGKTHLAVAVLHELISQYRVRGRFVDAMALKEQLQGSLDRNTGWSTVSVLEPLQTAEVLVFDELGSGTQKATSWTADVLYNLINSRYQRSLPTLFTTNYRLDGDSGSKSLDRGRDPDPVESLSYRIPSRLISRLYEMAQPILFDGVSDYRRDVFAHRHGR